MELAAAAELPPTVLFDPVIAIPTVVGTAVPWRLRPMSLSATRLLFDRMYIPLPAKSMMSRPLITLPAEPTPVVPSFNPSPVSPWPSITTAGTPGVVSMPVASMVTGTSISGSA